MMMAVLQIDYTDHASPAHDRHRQKSFVTVFRELVKKLKAGIVRGTLWDGNRFAVLSDPSCNSLPDAELQAIDGIRVRILGGAKDEFITFKHIDKTGVTFYEGSCEIDNASKNVMKAIGRAEAYGDFMEHINM